MDTRIAVIVCLVMIGCYSSTLNRNRRQLESDYETTTMPSEDTGYDEIDFIEEISTVANFEVPDYVQNTEQQNDTDLTPDDLLLESIVLSFMESDDSFEEVPENLSSSQPDISEPILTSFLSQREQLNKQIKNQDDDIENVQGKSILFDDWSVDSIINTESNIQKINQRKRDVSKMVEEANDFTRRYAATHLDEFTKNMDILKKKKESKYYTRYAEKFPDEQSKDITRIDIESISDKPIVVKDITTMDGPGKGLMEYKRMHSESLSNEPRMHTDLLEKHVSLHAFKRLYDEELLDRSTKAVDVSEKHKEPEESIRFHTESISDKSYAPIDILGKLENSKEFTEAYATKDLERPREEMAVTGKSEELKDFKIMHAEGISERSAMPIGILENCEETEEYSRIHTKRVPEENIEFEDILGIYGNPSEMVRRYSERHSEKPIDLRDTLYKQEKPQQLTKIPERFLGEPTELSDAARLHEKPRAFTKVNAEIVPNKRTYAIEVSEKQKESKPHSSLYSETIVDKPTWRTDILRRYENPQAFTGVYTKKISDSPTGTIYVPIKHRDSNQFARTHTGTILDEHTMPIDFSEMNEELQEFIKTHAKRVPEKLIDSMGILNKQEKQQELTGIYSEIVPEKPDGLIDDLSTQDKPQILTEMRAGIVPEKNPYEMYISNKQKELKTIHTESMIENPTMRMDILEKHYIPQVYAGVYAKEVSARPTEMINTMVKQKGPNGFQRTSTEISDEVTIPIERLGDKETREFTRIYDIRVPERHIDLEDVHEHPRALIETVSEKFPDKSTYSFDISNKQIKLKQQTREYPESLTVKPEDKPSWRIDILRKYEKPQMPMASNKDVSDRPIETIYLLDKYEQPKAFGRTYTESIADKVDTIPIDRLGNIESRQFTRIHDTRVPTTSNREEPRALTEPHAEIVPDKKTYAIDVSEKQKESKEYTRTYPETISDKLKMRMHEEPMTFTEVYAKEVSDRPHEITRTYIESKSEKFTMPTHGLRNEEATDFARIHAIRVPESMSFLNNQENLREFIRIYAEKVLEKRTDLSDVSSVHEKPRELTENHAKIVPDEGAHTIDILKQQKELKEGTKIHLEAMTDIPTRRTDIIREHKNPQEFAGIDIKEASDRLVSVIQKEPNDFTRTYTGSMFDEITMPVDFLRNHGESRKYSRIHSIKVPEKHTDVVDALNKYEELRAPAKFNSEIVPNKSTYAIDISEKQKDLKEYTRTYPEPISDKLKMGMHILRNHEKPMMSTGIYAKEASDGPAETIDVPEKRKMPYEFTRSTESKPEKFTMPAHDIRNKEARDFAMVHAIRVPETPSEIVDDLRVHEKLRAPTKINAEIVTEKITYPMDVSEKREFKEFTGSYTGSLSNEARMRMALLEKYKKALEFEGLHDKEISTRPTQIIDVSEKVNNQEVFNKMYTEDIDSSVKIGPTYIGLGLRTPNIEKNNSKRQSFFRSSLRSANSTIPSTKVDTHRLTPDLLDELEPLPSLEFFDNLDEDDLPDGHDDNIQQLGFLESNSSNKSSTSSGLQSTTIMRVPASYIDMYRLPPDHFDKIEPISPLDSLEDEDWDNFSEENQNIEQPNFIARAISAVLGLFMSLRRSSSEIYEIFGRLFG